jgi:hypothetical protein
MYVRRFVSSLPAWERINRFAPNLSCLFLETRKRTKEGQNAGKASWIRVPVRPVPLARKLSTAEERRQDQSCLFRKVYYRNKDQNCEKLSCVRVPVKIIPVARELNTIEEQRQDRNCIGERIKEPRSQTRTSVLGSSPGENGFCGSKTKHDRRTALSPKLFVSTRKLRNKGQNPENCLGHESLCWYFLYLGNK